MDSGPYELNLPGSERGRRRRGSFFEGWLLLPSIEYPVDEIADHCGDCDLRCDCDTTIHDAMGSLVENIGVEEEEATQGIVATGIRRGIERK
jgi:hypothetical protein